MEETYCGHVIVWKDFYKRFDVYKDKVQLRSFETVSDAKKWLEQKCKQKFKRVPIIANSDFSEKMYYGHATSLIDDKYAWVVVSYKGTSRRTKELMTDIWLDDLKNREIISEIEAKYKERDVLSGEIRALKESAQKLTADFFVIDDQKGGKSAVKNKVRKDNKKGP
jgi:hypothetical protein